MRTSCTDSLKGRALTFRPTAEYEIFQQARIEQDTAPWRRRYGHRAGVEGTISQGVGAFGLRGSRYCGLAKTPLQHHFTGAATHLARIDAWLTGRPHARTRIHPSQHSAPLGEIQRGGIDQQRPEVPVGGGRVGVYGGASGMPPIT
ncbi:transposase [Streptomyces sp. NPDC096176]|uniref:transposase n=1 Tax=Streptomyces sp. NPDC096176 TaxID=3366079 RepID=UPI0038060506